MTRHRRNSLRTSLITLTTTTLSFRHAFGDAATTEIHRWSFIKMGNSVCYVAKETFQPEAAADGASPYLSIKVQSISDSGA